MNKKESDLEEPVRRRRKRVERARREGERSIGENLAWVGVLGWLVVVPILLFMCVGLWLDRRAGAGVFWTATLMFVGAALGAWMAWKRMHEA